MHYPNSPSRDIWSSNSSKIYNTVKTRSASVNDYSTEDVLNILPSPVMTGVGSHRSRLHSFPIGEGINPGSRMNLDVVEDTFCSGPTSLKSGLANLASNWHSNGFQVQQVSTIHDKNQNELLLCFFYNYYYIFKLVYMS